MLIKDIVEQSGRPVGAAGGAQDAAGAVAAAGMKRRREQGDGVGMGMGMGMGMSMGMGMPGHDGMAAAGYGSEKQHGNAW